MGSRALDKFGVFGIQWKSINILWLETQNPKYFPLFSNFRTLPLTSDSVQSRKSFFIFIEIMLNASLFREVNILNPAPKWPSVGR